MIETALTPAQQQFAAEHHNLVYSFLNTWNLDETEFYDVVIFGYIGAVKEFFTKSGLADNFKFSTIAYRAMQMDLFDFYRRQNRQKRKGTTLSLDSSTYSGGDFLLVYEAIPANNSLLEELETELVMQELEAKLPPRQTSILRMKADGCGVREIAKEQRMTVRCVQDMLAGLRDVVLDACFG